MSGEVTRDLSELEARGDDRAIAEYMAVHEPSIARVIYLCGKYKTTPEVLQKVQAYQQAQQAALVAQAQAKAGAKSGAPQQTANLNGMANAPTG